MAQEFVNSHIAPNKVVVFGKTACPFCATAVNLLEELHLNPGCLEYVDLSSQSNVEEIQKYFLQLTGARTMPRIFIGETCIGGFSDLDSLKRSGELEPMLKKVGAL